MIAGSEGNSIQSYVFIVATKHPILYKADSHNIIAFNRLLFFSDELEIVNDSNRDKCNRNIYLIENRQQ